MARRITGNLTSTYAATLSNEDYTLVGNATISATKSGFGISAADSVSRISVTVLGDVSAGVAGLNLLGTKTSVWIGADAMVSGATGVVLGGGDSDFVSRGVIAGDNFGVRLDGNSNDVENRGMITAIAGSGIFGSGNDDTIVNQTSGVIIASYGVYDTPEAGYNSTIVNRGKIVSDVASIYTEAGDTHVVNSGVLVGDVLLGAGDDSFNGVKGALDGNLVGGAGNDTLTTDRADLILGEKGGQGSDTVRSYVSYSLSANVEQLILIGGDDISGVGNKLGNVLRGNAADNILKGAAGADHLYGNKGADALTGGGGADTFHFVSGDGQDRIGDYADEIDHIDLSGWAAIADFADLKANHAANVGADVVISAGSDQLLIRNTQKSELDAGDFIF